MDGACWVCFCFCCRHSPILDMNVRIFWVYVMECMCAQTSPHSYLKEFKGMESEPMLTPREKSPLLEVQSRMEPVMLHHAGQQAQHNTSWAIPEPFWSCTLFSLSFRLFHNPDTQHNASSCFLILRYILIFTGFWSSRETTKQHCV